MQKYKNKKVDAPEGYFDSLKEYKRYKELKELEKLGAIEDLRRQVPFELIPKQKLHHSVITKGRARNVECAVKYWADFTYKRDGKLVVEDAKGLRTPQYILKRKLMLERYDIQIEEV